MPLIHTSPHERAVRFARWFLSVSGLALLVAAGALLTRGSFLGTSVVLVFAGAVLVIVSILRPPHVVVSLMLLLMEE